MDTIAAKPLPSIESCVANYCFSPLEYLLGKESLVSGYDNANTLSVKSVGIYLSKECQRYTGQAKHLLSTRYSTVLSSVIDGNGMHLTSCPPEEGTHTLIYVWMSILIFKAKERVSSRNENAMADLERKPGNDTTLKGDDNRVEDLWDFLARNLVSAHCRKRSDVDAVAK
jgi:hypothetical protein